jgi:hypothetical protein
MGTEDDLRRGGQAAVALVGLAAARAKSVAEQLLGSRSKPREEPKPAKSKGELLVEEGKHAAAEVIGALRKEASVILGDLQQLERTLRGQAAESAERPEPVRQTTPMKKAARSPKAAPAKARPSKAWSSEAPSSKASSAQKASATKRASGAKKAAATKKAPAANTAVPSKKAVPAKKQATAKKQGAAKKAAAARGTARGG